MSRELGNRSAINGFQAESNYFQNTFDNKIRTFTSLTSTESSFDNVPDARISGFESKLSVFLFRKKITVGLGLSCPDAYLNLNQMSAENQSRSRRDILLLKQNRGDSSSTSRC